MMKTIAPESMTKVLQPYIIPLATRNGRGRLVSLTRPWPERVGHQLSAIWLNPDLAFLRQWPDVPRVYWEGGGVHRAGESGSVAFAGCGVAAVLTADGPDRFRAIHHQAVQLFHHAVVETGDAPPIVGPRLFGGFAFRADQGGQGIWSAFPAAYFVLPRYQLTRVGRWTWLTVNHLLEPGEDPEQVTQQLQVEIRRLLCGEARVQGSRGAEVQRSGGAGPSAPPLLCSPAPSLPGSSGPRPDIESLISPEEWSRRVTVATECIRRGELAKVVLAQACRMRASRIIDPIDMLDYLGQNYSDCYRFLIEPIPGHAFYGATPEFLAEVNGSTVRTVALAGSSRRGRWPEEDAALGEALLASPKDRHEHALVVEAIQENLLPLVTKLHVPSGPGLCRLSNIQHLQTVIRGELTEARGVLPVVEALHPTPAVGGFPRDVALRLIEEMEPFSRGWYASPVGWIDYQGNGLFTVAIRSAVSVGNETWLFAGAGIVAGSDPEREWEEVRLKFRPILEALGWGRAPDRAPLTRSETECRQHLL